MTQATLNFTRRFDPEAYLAERPEIYPLFAEIAEQMLHAGYDHYSARDILPVIRWQRRTDYSSDGLKVNNNISSHLARKLANEDGRFKDFFQFRRAG